MLYPQYPTPECGRVCIPWWLADSVLDSPIMRSKWKMTAWVLTTSNILWSTSAEPQGPTTKLINSFLSLTLQKAEAFTRAMRPRPLDVSSSVPPPSKLPMFCTEWGPQALWITTWLIASLGNTQARTISRIWTYLTFSRYSRRGHPFGYSVNELINSLRLLQSIFAVFSYLTLRVEVHKMLPLIDRRSIVKNIKLLDDTKEQGVLEVATWSMKGVLNSILYFQSGAQWSLKNISSKFSQKYARAWSLCGRIMFHNVSYININWIGLWVTTAVLMFICLVGSR